MSDKASKNFLLNVHKILLNQGNKVPNGFFLSKSIPTKIVYVFQDDNIFMAKGGSSLVVCYKSSSIFSDKAHYTYKKIKSKQTWGTISNEQTYLRSYNYIKYVIPNLVSYV